MHTDTLARGTLTLPERETANVPGVYGLTYANRRNGRAWVIPLAGTSIQRRSLILPAVKSRGLTPLELNYTQAQATMAALNRHLRALGIPGRIFADFLRAE